jgi:hypothetical protein
VLVTGLASLKRNICSPSALRRIYDNALKQRSKNMVIGKNRVDKIRILSQNIVEICVESIKHLYLIKTFAIAVYNPAAEIKSTLFLPITKNIPGWTASGTFQ